MYESQFDGIRFIEGCPENVQIISAVSVKIGGFLASTQLKNLDDVKRELAQQAKKQGATAVVNFEYGQRSAGILASIFSRDDVNWYGNGELAILPE